MNSQEPQNVQTVWNVPPVIRWEHNNNYGMNALISGIITEHGIAASIDPRTDRVGFSPPQATPFQWQW